MEKIQNGKRKLVYMPKDLDVDEELAEFEKLGIKEIWVTTENPIYDPATCWISCCLLSWRHPLSDTSSVTLDHLS